jgi:hypothetical protein
VKSYCSARRARRCPMPIASELIRPGRPSRRVSRPSSCSALVTSLAPGAAGTPRSQATRSCRAGRAVTASCSLIAFRRPLDVYIDAGSFAPFLRPRVGTRLRPRSSPGGAGSCQCERHRARRGTRRPGNRARDRDPFSRTAAAAGRRVAGRSRKTALTAWRSARCTTSRPRRCRTTSGSRPSCCCGCAATGRSDRWSATGCRAGAGS